MKLDVLGMPLYEGLLFTLGCSPGTGLWASLGRREASLCQMFAIAYPTRTIQHFSANNWTEFAATSDHPGAYLINLELEIARKVIEFAAQKEAFCMAGLYTAGGRGLETLLANMPEDILQVAVRSAEQFSRPLELLECGKPIRLILSLEDVSLWRPGDLRGVNL